MGLDLSSSHLFSRIVQCPTFWYPQKCILYLSPLINGRLDLWEGVGEVLQLCPEGHGSGSASPDFSQEPGHFYLLLSVLWNRNYLLRFRFRFGFWLLKSYGSGSGSVSNFWKVMVPVPVPIPTFEKVTVPFPVPVPAPYLDHKKHI